MPFTFSAAPSSRIVKKRQTKSSQLKHSLSSSLADSRRKPSKAVHVADNDEDDFFRDQLDEIALVRCLSTDLSLRDVPQTMQHIRMHMFDPVPERGGMNSTKIAEILNFRKSLPPTVTMAHVHALIGSPTAVEREIAELTLAGLIRKTVVPRREIGASSISEGIILSKDLKLLLSEVDELDREVKDKFLRVLEANPTAMNISRKLLTDLECISLKRAGFLTTASPYILASNPLTGPDSSSRGTMTSIFSVSKAASGTIAAAGGEGAVHKAGNTGKSGVIPRTHTRNEQVLPQKPPFLGKDEAFNLALPNSGPFLKLLTSARNHLLSLLLKAQYRELPIYLLRERWDGGIAGDNPAAKAKQYRGEFRGILPSRTRKWKQFSGLSFDWVLAECLGAGLIEVFETGSVGRAVRGL